MPSGDAVAAAVERFRHALETDRVAHAYLVLGPPRGGAARLAEGLLELLFCGAAEKPCGRCRGCRLVRAHAHEDVLWVEPESKSRAITVDRIREEVLPRIFNTAYSGGWKAAVIVAADRMNEAAANAFLKSLEEPPPRTVLLLLTDAPQQLLPTIVSRCQILRAEGGGGSAHDAWRARTLDLLSTAGGDGLIERLAAAVALSGLLDEIKEAVAAEIEAAPDEEVKADVRDARINARVNEVRAAVLETLLDWQRDLLVVVLGADAGGLRFPDRAEALRRQASRLEYGAALARIRRVEEAIRQLERNLAPESVFGALFREMA